MLARFFHRQKPIVIGPERAQLITVRPARPIVIGPGRAETILEYLLQQPTVRIAPGQVLEIAPGKVITIAPQPRGVWDEKGWVCSVINGNQIFQGYFQVAGLHARQSHRFPGRIIISGGEIKVFIANPPAEIQNHPKGPCFSREQGVGWFRLHWHHSARNVDDAILYMEKILAECLNPGRRPG